MYKKSKTKKKTRLYISCSLTTKNTPLLVGVVTINNIKHNYYIKPMTIHALQRILWRLRTKYPNQTRYHNLELRRCIMIECGTDQRTVWSNLKALKTLQFIKRDSTNHITLTDEDLNGNF